MFTAATTGSSEAGGRQSDITAQRGGGPLPSSCSLQTWHVRNTDTRLRGHFRKSMEKHGQPQQKLTDSTSSCTKINSWFHHLLPRRSEDTGVSLGDRGQWSDTLTLVWLASEADAGRAPCVVHVVHITQQRLAAVQQKQGRVRYTRPRLQPPHGNHGQAAEVDVNLTYTKC